jgi:VWFA-related protein
MPAAPVKREDVHRTLVLFIGDLATSAESIPGIRAGAKKFVLEQVHPGDLVAVVRSSAGLGALQDFTTDKGMLLAAIDQVRFSTNAVGTGMASAYTPIGQPGLGGFLSLDLAQLDKIDSADRGTLETTATLLRVVRRMADLPGRKSVVLIADQMRLTSPDEMDPMSGQSAIGTGAFLSPIYQSMRRVVDESVRSGVVLYAIDTRGLTSLRALASDHLEPSQSAPGRAVAPVAPNGIDPYAMTAGRRAEYSDNQWGGIYLTAQTGGFMVTESNRLEASLDRIMADQRGYYLLGFQPPADAMEPDIAGTPEFHKLKVEVLRHGLSVRSHAGFFGIGEEYQTATSTPTAKMSKAIDSPFESSDIHIDAEASYLIGPKDYFIRATVYIDGKDVVFTGPPIHRAGTVHMVVRAFNANGGSPQGGIDQLRRIDVDEDGYRRAREYGLIYTTLLTVPKPGPYRVRVACMDEATGKIGTAGDFVAIPPSNGAGLRMSGIVFQHDLGTDDHVIPAFLPDVYAAGQVARFSFQIASNGPKPKLERMEMRTRLYRDGVEAWHSEATPLAADNKKSEGYFATGSIAVPKGLDPGKYLLRVDVEDKDAPGTSTVWQWAKLNLR